MILWEIADSGIRTGKVQDEIGISYATKSESTEKIIIWQKYTGASLKVLSLTKSGTIIASEWII